MTLGTQWSWKPGDQIKSVSECMRILARCAGGDGNLLLNVGPMPTGEIEPRQVEVLRGIGNWLEQNGESIYGTRGGRSCRPSDGQHAKGITVYLHLLKSDWSRDPFAGCPPGSSRAACSGAVPSRSRSDAAGLCISTLPEKAGTRATPSWS